MSTPKKQHSLQKQELKLPKLAPLSEDKQRKGAKIHSFRTTSQVDVGLLEVAAHMKQQAKLISSWFKAWRPWQRRIILCSVILSCSKSQLSVLMTSLEPLLHRDFSAFLAPKAAYLKQRSPVHGSLKRFEEESVEWRSDLRRSLSECAVPVCINTEGACEPDACSPRLPPLHGKHHQVTVNSLQLQSEDFFSFKRKQFGTPLALEYSACLLHSPGKVSGQRVAGRVGRKRSKSWTPSTVVKPSTQRLTENFKSQQAELAKLFHLWDGYQKTWLLLEIVKLCDNEQLGYLAQCIHQRLLEDHHGTDLLHDPLLLNIFSMLDPRSLARASQVCRRWHRLCSSDVLWRDHCLQLGEREGLERLADALEALSGGHHVYWQQAYRQLSGVIKRVKNVVVKAASAREYAEEKEEEGEEEDLLTPPASLATLKSTLSLRQMIQIVRDTSAGLSSTRDVLKAAPESAIARRRRLRAERRAAALLSAEQERQGGGGLEEGTGQERSEGDSGRQPLDEKPAQLGVKFVGGWGAPQCLTVVEETERLAVGDGAEVLPNLSASAKDSITVSSRRREVQLVPVVTDTRPVVPSLPHPEGLRCLVLSGCLADGATPIPGRLLPIPRVKRLVAHDAGITCATFDVRKVVSGSADMTARVHDMRSGREVRVLQGHKGGVRCLRCSEDCLVTGSWDTQCIVWDLVQSLPLAVLSGHTSCVSCMDMADGHIVTGSYDCTVRVWHASLWHCMHVIHAHKSPVTCVLLDSGQLLSGSWDCSVKVWELETTSCVGTLQHPAGVVAMEKSKLLLVTATTVGGLHMWDMTDLNPIVHWSLHDCGVSPDTTITAMCMDRSHLMVGASDGCLYEWDVSTGTCVRFLRGHSQAVTSVQYGAHRFVTVSDDMTICVWYTREALRDDNDDVDPDPGDGSLGMFMAVPIRIISI